MPGDSAGLSSHSPLSGIRIVSLAEQYPGPFATMILSDLGADVIMVERPGSGDPTRRFSGHFAAITRGKRSVAIDLKSPDGIEVFLRLASTADVVVEGFRPGTLDRLGIGPEMLRGKFPHLVVASISSFGQTGPLSNVGAHDISAQGMAGFIAEDEGQPAPLPLADLASACFTAIGIVSALLHRQRSDHGTTLDISMLDSLLALRSTALVSSMNGLDPAPYPPLDPGYGVFRTNVGTLITLSIAGEDHQWRALCSALGLVDIADLREAERDGRRVELRERVQASIESVDWVDLAPALQAGGVGFGPVNGPGEVVSAPQVVARSMVVEVEDGTGLRVIRQPVLFDGQYAKIRTGVPSLGQHTCAVLSEVGLGAEEINLLLASGVVATEENQQS